jgi:hypothetical protein
MMNNRSQIWKSSVRVELFVEDFDSLTPTHLFSLIENDHSSDIEASANADFLQGLTEWFAPWQGRRLTFGIDWCFQKSTRVITARWTTLRSNVIVVDRAGADLGEDCLHLYVALIMTRVRWEEAVIEAMHFYRVH